MLRRIAMAACFSLAGVAVADAMDFTWRDHLTVLASGRIEKGDAAKFAALPKFDTLELDSPGGLVGEALRMAANMDARGGIRTVVKPGTSCASACAMALFVSGKTRIVYMGGRIGIHSCATPANCPPLVRYADRGQLHFTRRGGAQTQRPSPKRTGGLKLGLKAVKAPALPRATTAPGTAHCLSVTS